MTTLTYACPPEIAKFVHKAAREWNTTLRDLVELKPVEGGKAEILIMWGKIDRVKHPTRIAECRHLGVDSWLILLSDQVPWAVKWWDRFIGRGEDVLSAMLHELGHVFDLPHASDPFFVMFPEIPRVKSLSIKEKSLYRGKFLRELEDFDES